MLSSEEIRVIEKIQFYRKSAKKTQEELANELDMSRTTLVAIEKGERKLKAEELVKIAEILGIPLSEITRRSSFNSKEQRIQFRKYIGLESSNPEMEIAIEKFFSLCEKYLELEEKIGNQFHKAIDAPEYSRAGSILDVAARRVANRERQRLGLGDAPIPESFSVLLENESGLNIFKLPIEEYKFSGAYLYDSQVGGCILINSKHPNERQRFTLAHEYGHFLADRKSLSIDEGEEDNPFGKKPDSEKFADLFAVYFLLPPDGVLNQFQLICQRKNEFTLLDIVSMSEYFQVSFQAMCMQLEQLECIDKGTYSLYKNKFKPSKFRKRKEDNDSIFSRFPKRYQEMAFALYQSEELSHGELQELFESGVIEINDFIAKKEDDLPLQKDLLKIY